MVFSFAGGGRKYRGGGGEGGGACSFVACLSHLIINRAFRSRRSTVPDRIAIETPSAVGP